MFNFCNAGVLPPGRCRPQHFKPKLDWRFATICPWFSTSGVTAGLWMGVKLKTIATGSWQSAMFQRISRFTGTVSMVRASHCERLTLYCSNAHLRGLGPTEVLSMGGCETSAHIHPIKNAQWTRQSCCAHVQTHRPSCSSSKPLGAPASESTASVFLLLWISASKRLPRRGETGWSLQPLCYSSMLHGSLPCTPCSFHHHPQRCPFSG